jgi:hypothetical protein
MNLSNWLFGWFSTRARAVSFYKQGVAKAKRHDHQGAIEAYTTTIGMPEAPADVKGMALYNRALAYLVIGDDGKGADDLGAILAMNAAMASVNVKTMARQELARLESRPVKSCAKRRS